MSYFKFLFGAMVFLCSFGGFSKEMALIKISANAGLGEGYIYSKVDCDKEYKVNFFGDYHEVLARSMPIWNRPVSVSVNAGVPVILLVNYSVVAGADYLGVNTNGCSVYFSFVPASGASYSIRSSGCEVGLIDDSSGDEVLYQRYRKESVCPVGSVYWKSIYARTGDDGLIIID